MNLFQPFNFRTRIYYRMLIHHFYSVLHFEIIIVYIAAVYLRIPVQ